MTEQRRCSVRMTLTDGTQIRCNGAAVVNASAGWRCLPHTRLAPGWHLLSEAALLQILGDAVRRAESECQAGHTLKIDEVAIGHWEHVKRALGGQHD